MSYYAAVETFRDAEYPMMQGKVYLDHGGTTIYARSLIEKFSEKLLCNLYGNPHSESDPAQLSGRVVEATRAATLEFFGAAPQHFDLIFTANATAAIKLVAESFLDLATTSGAGSFFYGYHRDAHTSIVGIRELTNNGTHHCFGTDEEVEQWLSGDASKSQVPYHEGLPGLFAYPGQSNMNGRRLPLSWTRKLRESKRPHHQNTYSLLDAAALATTTQLDLSDPDSAPDFIALSFYKIFGFPDLGALLVRKKSGHILSWRRFFGGGTVNMLTVLQHPSVQRKDAHLHEALEDGTLPFHNIIALGCAIEVHKKLYGSMRTISLHTSYLARRLHDGLSSLEHSNGLPVCIIYNESSGIPYGDSTTQGATIAFSVVRQDGAYFGHSVVEQRANEGGIYLRSGGLCNAGGIAHHLQIEPWQFKRAWSSGYRCGGGGDGAEGVINGKPTGVVRASLGAMSTLSDVEKFLKFMAVTFQTKPELEIVSIVQVNEGEDFDFELPQEVIRFADQGFDYLQRTDSGFHSRSNGSNASISPPLNPVVKRISSMSNLGYEQQRSKLRTHQSQQSLRTGNVRRRGARLILPVPVQIALEESYASNQRVPFGSLDLNGGRKLTNYSGRIPHHTDQSDVEFRQGEDMTNEKKTKFRFWMRKKVRVP